MAIRTVAETNLATKKDFIKVKTSLSLRISGVERNLEDRIDNVETKLTNRIDSGEARLTKHIDSVEVKLTKRMDSVETKLTERIDNLETGQRFIMKTLMEHSKQLDELNEKTKNLPRLIDAVDVFMKEIIESREERVFINKRFNILEQKLQMA